MKRILACLLICCAALKVGAQVDTVYTKRYLERSTKFAWLTLGGDILALPNGDTDYLQGENLRNTTFSSGFVPRVTIGGVHFWGYADFYVTFPLSFLTLQSTPDDFQELDIRQGVETGFRLFPVKLQPKRLSPFLGISFRSSSYSHEIEGDNYTEGAPRYTRMTVPVQFGLAYTTNKLHIAASAYLQSTRNFKYYISPEQEGNTTLNPVTFNVSVLRYWDTDRDYRTEKAWRSLNKRHEILKKENRLSTWYIGVGPSAGLQMSRSSFLEQNYPFLADTYSSGLMPDITFGRFFNRPDMNVGVSYRTFGDRIRGFDTSIRMRRHSFMVEAYKNLFNWLGFVPYVGVTGAIENLTVEVNDQTYQETKPALGFIAGWDIRVTKTGTSLLRTNLRWTPDLHLSIEGDRMMFDHLEFNFIQWVQFLGRGKVYKKYSK
ncbi:MAG: hypothetical protein ACFB0B_07785 [Thermonemataceae bacterium]